MKSSVFNRIIRILNENLDPNVIESITLDTRLDELSINSVAFIQFVVLLENEFQIEFEDENLDIGMYNTLKDVCVYIENRIAVCEAYELQA